MVCFVSLVDWLLFVCFYWVVFWGVWGWGSSLLCGFVCVVVFGVFFVVAVFVVCLFVCLFVCFTESLSYNIEEWGYEGTPLLRSTRSIVCFYKYFRDRSLKDHVKSTFSESHPQQKGCQKLVFYEYQ